MKPWTAKDAEEQSTMNSPHLIHLLGMVIAVRAASVQTNGAFSVVESTLPPHFRQVQPHWHKQKAEAFYILEGALTFTLDDRTFIAHRGSFVLAPPGAVHVYWNSTAAPVTVLTISAPGGLECYLAELAECFAEQSYEPTLAAAIALRYDQFPPAPMEGA